MRKHTVCDQQGMVLQEWNDDTRTYTDRTTGEQRPYTAEENAFADAADAESAESTVRSSLEDKAAKALGRNNTFLGLNNPTNAQVVAQVKVLTRENNALIRLLLRRLDADDA